MAGNTAGNTKGFSQVSQEYFRMNAKNIIEEMRYLDFSSDVWELFCSTEGTGCSQKELFEFSVKWAKQRCRDNNLEDTPEQLRSLLSEVLKKLRFTEMSTQEFLDHVLPTFILNNEEVGKVIAEKRKKAEDTIVQVLMKKHYSNVTEVTEVQLSTKILQLKKTYIFLERYSNKFEIHHDFITLSHKDKVLSDDTCLESIYTPGEQLVLEVHSVVYNVKVAGTEIAFPIAIEGKKVREARKIIKSHLHCFHDIHPDDVAYVDINHSGLPRGENHEADVKLRDYVSPLWRFFRKLDTFLGITSLITFISILVILAVIHPMACSMLLCTVVFFKIGNLLLFQHDIYVF